MGVYPPDRSSKLCKLLENLGFIQKRRVGKGKHLKYFHPTKKDIAYGTAQITIRPTIM